MAKFSTNSKSDVLIHLGIIAALATILFFLFFFVYLPWTTNHGESISVPELKGLSIEESERILSKKDLEYEVSDSTFISGQKPLSVFSQYPKPNANVKSGRKIYLTIISDKAPKVAIPNVIGRSTNSAKNQLLSSGLIVESVKEIPAIEENTVLKIEYDGKEVSMGQEIPKGSKLTLLVGDGYKNQKIAVPSLIGMSQDEAEILAAGLELSLGSILFDNDPEAVSGSVIKQKPESGLKVPKGTPVNIWIAN